jgi:hypothetical protein
MRSSGTFQVGEYLNFSRKSIFGLRKPTIYFSLSPQTANAPFHSEPAQPLSGLGYVLDFESAQTIQISPFQAKVDGEVLQKIPTFSREDILSW